MLVKNEKNPQGWPSGKREEAQLAGALSPQASTHVITCTCGLANNNGWVTWNPPASDRIRRWTKSAGALLCSASSWFSWQLLAL